MDNNITMSEQDKLELAKLIIKRLNECGGRYYPAYGAVEQVVCVLDAKFPSQNG